ncbi:hypothetical protein [Dactylosporangium sp. NPDC048998]|uniref:hypothetical protein n=1 Tax=Dactylosporangium sp. NPDC048998 TaxID=3363976 RepID=UPI00372041D7
MDLSEALHEASETPPPTAIDVDRLIAGEQRRACRLRLTGVVAAVAVVALGTVTLPRYFGESQAPPVAGAPDSTAAASPRRAPSPCVTPSPTGQVIVGGGTPIHPVSEACGAAIARLSEAIGTLLARELPGLEPRNIRDGGAMPPLVERDPHWAAAYVAGFDFDDGGRRSYLGLTVHANSAEPAAAASGLACRGQEAGCSEQMVDGAIVLVHRDRVLTDGFQINVFHPDGTAIILIARAAEEGYDAPFTEAQLVKIAAAPELTLYP